jgi:MFS family permease
MKIKISGELGFIVSVSSAVIPGVMSTAMLSLAFGDIATFFDISYQVLQWRNVLFFSTFAISILYFSAVVPRYGARRALIAAQVLFVVAAFVASLTSNWIVFLLAQTCQAIADGVMVPAQMSLLRHYVAKERWGWAFGWFQGTLAIATLIGPLSGALLIARFGWQSIPAVLAILQSILLLISLRLPVQDDSNNPGQRPPVLSAFILFMGLCLTQLALQYIGDHVTSVMSWLSAGGLCVLMVLFILREWCLARGKFQTLVPWHSLKNIFFSFAILRIFLVFFVSNAASLHLPTALRAISSITVAEIGTVLTVAALLSAMLEPMLGRIADRWESGALVVGLTAMTLATSGYFFVQPWGALNALIFASLGGVMAAALFGPAQFRIATLSVDESERDHFMGFYMFCQFISGAFAATILGHVIEDSVTHSISSVSFHRYVAICVSMLAIATLTGIASEYIAHRARGELCCREPVP